MFVTGMSFTEKTIFMTGTLAAVPASSMHVFNFIPTMWGGRIKFAAPMLFSVGGIMLFYSAGAGGVVNTAIPLDFLTHDSYFVVGHFHLFVMGTVSMIFTGFIYHLFPFITGRMYHEKAAQVQFIIAMIGISLVFGTQHMLGLYGQPRRTLRLHSSAPIYHNEPNCNNWSLDDRTGTGVDADKSCQELNKRKSDGSPVENRDPFGIGEQYYNYARREPHLA